MENMLKVAIGFAGGLIGFLFGEWSMTLTVLVALVVMDYVTGMIAGYYEEKWSSKVGYIGIARKVFIFVMVTAAHLVDVLFIEYGMETNAMVMTAVILIYAVNEILSIIENAGRIGLPVPKFLINAVEVLKNKGVEK